MLRLHPSHQQYFHLISSNKALNSASSHGVTGSVYKARERIHRSIADLRLLAIPASCRRVAAYNPNLGYVSRLANFYKQATFCNIHCSTCVAQGIKGIMT